MDVIKFARKALKYCENKLVINGGPWYRWTLRRLWLKHEYETFGERSVIERVVQYLKKSRWKRFWKHPF